MEDPPTPSSSPPPPTYGSGSGKWAHQSRWVSGSGVVVAGGDREGSVVFHALGLRGPPERRRPRPRGSWRERAGQVRCGFQNWLRARAHRGMRRLASGTAPSAEVGRASDSRRLFLFSGRDASATSPRGGWDALGKKLSRRRRSGRTPALSCPWGTRGWPPWWRRGRLAPGAAQSPPISSLLRIPRHPMS